MDVSRPAWSERGKPLMMRIFSSLPSFWFRMGYWSLTTTAISAEFQVYSLSTGSKRWDAPGESLKIRRERPISYFQCSSCRPGIKRWDAPGESLKIRRSQKDLKFQAG